MPIGISSEEDPFTLEVIHTPGHTSGSVCFYLQIHPEIRYLFSGDTIFEGTVGRTDLGGCMEDMRASVEKIKTLPDDTVIFPGHGAKTTVSREKKTNPYFTGVY